MDAISYLDRLVKEYLLFRGFARTVTAFDNDSKSVPGLGFQAEQLCDHLFRVLLAEHRAEELVSLLSFLQNHVYSKLKGELSGAGADVEVRLSHARRA